MSERPPTGDCSDPSTQETAGDIDAQETDSPSELTPKEQMALYEKSLKEDNWGHQPC